MPDEELRMQCLELAAQVCDEEETSDEVLKLAREFYDWCKGK